MPGVWLGENAVPELTQQSDGSIRFAHYINRKVWPGILIVAGIGIPCLAGCTFLAIYGKGPVNPIFMKIVLLSFSVTVVGGLSHACWCADATLINTRSRTVTREYFFLGRRFWRKEFQILDQDYFAITTGDDEHGTGGFHRIYVCRDRHMILFSAIHLPSIKPSDTLIHTVDDIAQRLRIENRGYIGWRGVFHAWTRFIMRRT